MKGGEGDTVSDNRNSLRGSAHSHTKQAKLCRNSDLFNIEHTVVPWRETKYAVRVRLTRQFAQFRD